jgi:hypothetical protein
MTPTSRKTGVAASLKRLRRKTRRPSVKVAFRAGAHEDECVQVQARTAGNERRLPFLVIGMGFQNFRHLALEPGGKLAISLGGDHHVTARRPAISHRHTRRRSPGACSRRQGRYNGSVKMQPRRYFVAVLLPLGLAPLSPNLANASAPGSLHLDLPAQISLDEAACSGGPVVVTLRLENQEKLDFLVDTGSVITILDKSLEPELGHRIGTGHTPVLDSRAGAQGIYRAPKVYLGDTQLLTAPRISTFELHCPSGHPYRGILGMDCLRHYCIQFDFAARRMRFLDPDHLDTQHLGRSFPITAKGKSLTLFDADLFGEGKMRFLLDSGFSGPFDAMLAPKLYKRLLEEHKTGGRADLSMMLEDGRSTSAASFPRLDLCGQTYTDLKFAGVGLPHGIKGIIGLRFVARHLTTINFPKRVLYLKRISSGPLAD